MRSLIISMYAVALINMASMMTTTTGNMGKSHLEFSKLTNHWMYTSSKCIGVSSLSSASEQMHTSMSSAVGLTKSTVNHGAVLQQLPSQGSW